ncbi:hypothetical protein [Dongia sp.]|uniref:hypothetical protein n=1 Tax=Dongia sp. TaxID=1977262 RepID=UPI0035B3C746
MAALSLKEVVELGDRYEIAPGQRLPAHDCGMAEAYAATDRVDASRKIFALIAPGHLPNRGLGIAPTRNAAGAYLMWPVAASIVDWPVGVEGGEILWGRRPAFIYSVPVGEKLLGANGQIPQLNESQLLKNFIQPAIQLLRDLVLMNCPHRAIRPQNIYFQSGNAGDVMFGDCLASPPGGAQPVAFETVDSAMSDPIGRGIGSIADDIYAIGVTALMLYLGRDPVASFSDEQIINAKINSGSFSTMAGGEKLAPSLAEMFRGMLCDKVSDRWTIKHLEGWMTGAHFNPTLPSIPQRSSRPLKFCGGEYLNKPALAHAMSRHWNDAIVLLAGGDFDNWYKRGFGDEKAPDKMMRIQGLSAAYGSQSGIRDRTVARFIIHMGGHLPLCYKDIRTTLMGMGSMLSHYYERKEQVQQIAEMMHARLPHAWFEEQPNLRPEQMQLRRSLEIIDKVIDRQAPGYGIERVLYELDRGTPCKSPLIADYYVVDIADLLPAIDAAIPGAPHGTLPIDRHIAAFIATNMKRSMDNELIGLANRADDITYRTAILRLLAIVQRVNQQYELPRLTQVVIEMLEPVIAAFHNTGMREHIRGQVDGFAKDCRFDEMLLLLDGEGSLRRADNDGFAQAVQEYAHLERGRTWLANGGLTDTTRVRGIAHKAAAMTATLACSASLAAYGLYAVMF